MRKIVKATPLDGYQVELEFDDGLNGVVDLSHHAGKGVFSVWNDPDAFKAVRIGESGELVWADEIDLCPDALYLEVSGKKPEELFPILA